MHKIITTLFFVLPLFTLGQNMFGNIVHDTLPDFWNKKYIVNHKNKLITSDSKLLYVGLTFEEKPQFNFEFFRINDSLFHCIEYYQSGNKKSWGDYIVTSKIIWTDSVYGFDPSLDKQTLYAHHLLQILKSGEWNYASDVQTLSDLGDTWQGTYLNGVKNGIWRHYINGHNKLELKLVNYSLDSSKNLSIKNIINTSDIDILKQNLNGRWLLSMCESEEPYRMQYYKCNKTDNSFGDDCNNKSGKENYYDFNPKNIFQRQRGEGCNHYKEELTIGKWLLEKDKNDIFLILNINDKTTTEQWKFKIIYMDNSGNLVTERY